jgi:hypothetical protein
MQDSLLRDERRADLETGTVAKGSSAPGTHLALALNKDVEYDVTQCSALCCIEEFKVRPGPWFARFAATVDHEL